MTNLAMPGALNSIPSAPGTQSTGSASQSKSGSSNRLTGGLTESDFLKLLIAQLQNQDPTQPTNPQGLATEFSDLATVNGINSLNSKVSQIQSGTAAAQMGQAAGLIGKSVAVSGNTIVANGSGVATGAFSLSGPATSAAISIIDPTTGKTVNNISLTNLPAGINRFQWSGGTSDTSYVFQVGATGVSGTAVTATPYSVGQVSSVDLNGSVPSLSITGQLSPVPLSDVAGIIGG